MLVNNFTEFHKFRDFFCYFQKNYKWQMSEKIYLLKIDLETLLNTNIIQEKYILP